jgi:hypothetical protein
MRTWGRVVHGVVYGFWTTVSGLAIVCIAAILGVIVIATFQSDYSASAVQTETLTKNPSSPVEIVLRIGSISDQSNTAQATVVARSRRSLLDTELRSDTDKLTFQLDDGNPVSGIQRLGSVSLDKSSIQSSLAYAEGQPVSITLVTYHDATPYPFDKYESFVGIVPISPGQNAPDFHVAIVKTIAGRSMVVSGEPANFTIVLKRPWIFQVFVVVGALIFVSIILSVSFHLYQTSAWEKPVNQVVAIAGLFLSAAGFRDIIGLSKLASFSAMEALVIGIPLLVLATALLKGALVSLRRPNAIAKAGVEDSGRE